MSEPAMKENGDDAAVPDRPTGSDWLAYTVLVLAILFMAGNIIAGRAVRDITPPAGLTFWRCVVAVALALPIVAIFMRGQFVLILARWRLFLWLGLAWGVGGHYMVLNGLQTTSAINAGLIAATQPALAFLGAWLILGEPMSRTQVAGVIVGLIGVAVVVARGDIGVFLALDFVPGDFWVQGAMVGFVLFTVCLKRLPPAINPLAAIGATAFTSALCVAPLYAYEVLIGGRTTHADPATVQAVLYLAVFATLAAVSFLHIGVLRIGAGRANAFFYLSPVFAAALAVTLLGESFRGYHALGLFLVIAGIAFANRGPRTKPTGPG
jgi:drug/metabolite transporter (DMT)-like permease